MKPLLVVLLLALLVVTPLTVLAGTTVFSGTLTDDDSIYPNGRPDDADCGDQIDDLLPLKYHYELIFIKVTESGDYAYTDLRGGDDIDIEVAVYEEGAFQASSPKNGCLSSMDDDHSISLDAGITYVLAVTSWDKPVTGDYRFRLSGPGDIIEIGGSHDDSRAGRPFDPGDDRLNRHDAGASYSVYCQEDGGIIVFAIPKDGTPFESFVATIAEIEAAGTNPASAAVIDSGPSGTGHTITLYRRPDGYFQVNGRAQDPNKGYYVAFDACPPTDVSAWEAFG